MSMSFEDLVDRVTERTSGTEGDPLTRPEVEQVVHATLYELGHGAFAQHDRDNPPESIVEGGPAPESTEEIEAAKPKRRRAKKAKADG